ncbi:MAG TPA: 4'-phosphopantetheinyl transferase superfamily protein [Thermoanaerobaculia bacterium]|nr:4'-phosphopantetheinyl transferase superfamily protein [Thermoanaerobaculia bacterium]
MKIVELPREWRARAMVIRDVELSRDRFSTEELSIVDEFKLQKRREEWMRARIAAKELAKIARGEHVSFSHSGPYGGAAIDVGPIGIDVEVVRPIADAAAHLFLSEEEHEAARGCAIDDALLHFWCAKEAAWKQRQGAVPTLKQLSLPVLGDRGFGVLFEGVETVRVDDVIIALTVERRASARRDEPAG